MQMWTPCSRMLFSAGRLGSMQALKTLVVDYQAVYGTPVFHSRTCMPVHGDRHAPPPRQHSVRTYAATAGVSPECSTQDVLALHGGARIFDAIRLLAAQGRQRRRRSTGVQSAGRRRRSGAASAPPATRGIRELRMPLVCSIAPMQRRAQQQALFALLPAQHAAAFITILSGMLCMHVMAG